MHRSLRGITTSCLSPEIETLARLLQFAAPLPRRVLLCTVHIVSVGCSDVLASTAERVWVDDRERSERGKRSRIGTGQIGFFLLL